MENQIQGQEQEPHKRRVRYKGTHPRKYSEIATDVIRPSVEECARNSRARSTKMRWAVKA